MEISLRWTMEVSHVAVCNSVRGTRLKLEALEFAESASSKKHEYEIWLRVSGRPLWCTSSAMSCIIWCEPGACKNTFPSEWQLAVQKTELVKDAEGASARKKMINCSRKPFPSRFWSAMAQNAVLAKIYNKYETPLSLARVGSWRNL